VGDSPVNGDVLRHISHTNDNQKLQYKFKDEKGNTDSAPWRTQENGLHELVEILYRFLPENGFFADLTCGTAVSAMAALRLNMSCVVNDRDEPLITAAKHRLASPFTMNGCTDGMALT
jgi:hypothetical protein